MINRIYSASCWIVSFLLFLSLFPYFIWDFVEYSNWLISIPLFVLLSCNIKHTIDISYYFFFLFLSVWGAIMGQNNIIGIIMIAISSVLIIVDKSFIFRVYSRYRLIFVSFLAISLIVYLFVSFGFPLPYKVSPPPPRNTIDFNYYIYPFYACPSIDDWRNLGLNRFNALFDEPGVVGTISFIILFIEKFNLKKIGNIVLLISGVFSFSLFFYIACFVYLIYLFLLKRLTLIKRIIIFIITLVSIVQFSQTEIFKGYIGDRLLWNSESQTITGDDRSSESLKQYVKSIRGTTYYYFGNPKAVSQFQDSASIEKQILAHGFITVVLFFVFFSLYSYRYLRISKKWVLFLIMFVSIMYNRPTMFALDKLFLYFMMIFAWSDKYQMAIKAYDIAISSKYRLIRNL